MTYFARLECPLGAMWLTATTNGLTRVYLDSRQYFPRTDPEWIEMPDHEHLEAAARQLEEYFAGRRRQFDLSLDPPGTAFQRRVWDALMTIPFGKTRTYGEIAASLGDAKSTRAVASAIGKNSVAIIIPCHRVIGADGSLTGYAAGLGCKRALLELEEALPRTSAGTEQLRLV